jgi:hypothetical protein
LHSLDTGTPGYCAKHNKTASARYSHWNLDLKFRWFGIATEHDSQGFEQDVLGWTLKKRACLRYCKRTYYVAVRGCPNLVMAHAVVDTAGTNGPEVRHTVALAHALTTIAT